MRCWIQAMVFGLWVFGVCSVAVFSPVNAQVRINLDSPSADPLPLALPNLHGATPADAQLGAEIADVIRNNFQHSALFQVIDPQAYLQAPEQLAQGLPTWQDWRLINSDALLVGTVQQLVQAGQPKIRVDFRVFDVQTEQQLVGRRYTVDAQFWRHVGHRVADDIFTALTGESSYFATRIVHIGEQPGPNGQTSKRLCVMDQDGANYQCLTQGRDLVLTPRYDRDLQKIIYLSYANGMPRLYYLDLPTGRQEIVGNFEGLNSSPRFAPDNQDVAMTLTQGHEGNAEIYTMNLDTRQLVRLTNHRAIDTSPDFSPDGQQIVFNSDRGGKPALYIMDRDGANVRRLTYGKGSYFAPVWSPRGDLIAFVKQLGSTFHIGVIDPEGREERLLTDSFLDESPSWSPNGRVLTFARQNPHNNTTKIYTIDLTGHNLREIVTPTNASDPAWSPLIK